MTTLEEVIAKFEKYELGHAIASEGRRADLIRDLNQSKAQAVREARIDKQYWANPVTKHDVPCSDCGSKEWSDWLLLPHKLFNEVCPGGSGYLCFPCFVKRASQKALSEAEARGYAKGGEAYILSSEKQRTNQAIVKALESVKKMITDEQIPSEGKLHIIGSELLKARIDQAIANITENK